MGHKIGYGHTSWKYVTAADLHAVGNFSMSQCHSMVHLVDLVTDNPECCTCYEFLFLARD